MRTIDNTLKKDLVSEMPLEHVFQKHVIDGKSYFFREYLKKDNLEYEMRDGFAQKLQLNINEVLIVGSAKLGFSLKTHEFKNFDSDFEETSNYHKKSDIDIAIINRRLFDEIAKQIYSMTRSFDSDWGRNNWRMNEFYTHPTNLCGKYMSYLAKGWLRPDYLPAMYFDSAPWREPLDYWFQRLKRKISIGIYSDWYYLKHYQMFNLEKLRLKLINMEL